MNSLSIILERYWMTIQILRTYKESWICNWCWWKWGFNFSDYFERLPFFNWKKSKSLLLDSRRVCCIHDKRFYDWWNFIDFIIANYDLANDMIQLLYWTSIFSKITLWLLIFLWTTLFGWTNFNFKWKKIISKK